MAIVNGINYAKTIAVPAEKADPGEIGGRIKVLQEKYSLSAALSLNDEIDGPKLPIKAKVLDAYMKIDDMGGTGIFSLGHRANSSDSEDADAFVAAADAGDAAAFTRAAGEAGILKQFNEETQVYATVTEATTATSGDVEYVVIYVVD
jgi:hypothetical protein